MKKIVAYQYVTIFLMGLLIPLLSIYTLHLHHIHLLSLGEPGKYLRSAKGLFHTGHFTYFSHGHYLPELERMPGYPTFIAIHYLLFGLNNNVAILWTQSILMGSIVLAIALSVKIIHPKLMWPAALLAAICPNLGFRAAMVMPDLLFAFFIAWGLFFFIKAIYGNHLFTLLTLSTLLFTCALYTRPAFLLYPILTLPFVAYLLKSTRNYSVLKSCLLSLYSIVLVGVCLTPQLLRLHHYTDHYTLTTQGPDHALFWIYPCLSSPWGGKRNHVSLKKATLSQHQAIMQLPKMQRDHPGILYEINKKLTQQLISEIPLTRIITASIGSSLKLMFYTAFIGILEKLNMKVIKLSSHPIRVAKKVFSSPWSLTLLISQLLLMINRVLQIIGIIYGFTVSRWRALTGYLLAGSLSFVIISVSIGNPRYRSPLEPMLIIFSIFGIHAIQQYRKNRLLNKNIQ